MKRTFSLWGMLLLLAACLLAACQPDDAPEPIIVYVTATPEQVTAQIEPTFTATANLPAFPTSTPPPVIEATAIPLEPPRTPVDVASLPQFPTATPSATVEGVASPTPFTPPPTLEPVIGAPTQSPPITQQPGVGELPAFPTATPRPTEVFVLPADLADAEVVQPAAISGLAPPPEELPILVVRNLGMQVHPFVTEDHWRTSLGRTRELGIRWVKIQIPWEVAEPTPGGFAPEYRQMVDRVRAAHLNGFRVLISVNRAPEWARPAGFDPELHGPSEDPATYAAFITRLTTDIGSEFMEAIELWNEPNLLREWQGVPMDGQTYMRYFEAGYNAAKAVDPEVIVVTAGLAPVGDVPGQARDDRAFLREMYAGRLADFPTARIGVHPYGWGNPPQARCCSEDSWADAPQFFFLNTLEDYRDIMLENNDGERDMWLTELGWGTYQAITGNGGDATPPQHAGFFDLITPIEQAEYLLGALEIIQEEPFRDYIEMAFIWNMNFATLEGAVTGQLEQAGYSLLNEAGNPRLAFWYLLNTRKIY